MRGVLRGLHLHYGHKKLIEIIHVEKQRFGPLGDAAVGSYFIHDGDVYVHVGLDDKCDGDDVRVFKFTPGPTQALNYFSPTERVRFLSSDDFLLRLEIQR